MRKTILNSVKKSEFILSIAICYNLHGCAWKTQRICYKSGLCVNIAEKSVMQDNCYYSGMVNDKNEEIYKSQLRACYKPVKDEIWVTYGHIQSLVHELCHYFGNTNIE